ncbi:hypothetical protein V8J88_06040 [Massilia sp. W12]|uniref:J domain-containing protein n=1 Tax=Massilia sp. W12 TaxID=3126507 RepID=UPI0030CD2CCB
MTRRPPETTITLKIAAGSKGKTLNKGQKLFNQLTKKIQKLRTQIKDWEVLLPMYQQHYQEKFAPKVLAYKDRQQALLRLLDQAYLQQKFSKAEKKFLLQLIHSLLEELLAHQPNPELKCLYARYHGKNYDVVEEGMQSSLQAMMAEITGQEFTEEVDFRNPEAFLKMLAEQAQAQKERQADADEQAKSAKPDKRALQREAAQALAEQQLSQSLREVYRKLAAALHPDRAPDENERKRKTELMSRVNVAYDNKDLLRLLELQWEVEQIDAAAINALDGERLKHFNKILTEQHEELRHELQTIFSIFELRFPQMLIESGRGDNMPEAAQQMPYLFQLIQELDEDLMDLNQQLEELAEPQALKQWLKEYMEEQRCREREEKSARQFVEQFLSEDERELLRFMQKKGGGLF